MIIDDTFYKISGNLFFSSILIDKEFHILYKEVSKGDNIDVFIGRDEREKEVHSNNLKHFLNNDG